MARETIPAGDNPFPDEEPPAVNLNRRQLRRQRIRDEIERNRRGDYRVPTWALALILVAIIAAWALLIFTA